MRPRKGVGLGLVVLLALGLWGCGNPPPTTYQGYVEGEFVYVAGKIAGRLDNLSVLRGSKVTVGTVLFTLEHGASLREGLEPP